MLRVQVATEACKDLFVIIVQIAPVAELVLVLADPDFFGEQCSTGS